MGKRLIQQRRGRGTSRFRAPSFRYKGKITHNKLSKESVKGTIFDIIKCPGHSAPLMQVEYENGENVIMAAPEGLRVGDVIESAPACPAKTGNTMTLQNIPEGTAVYNLESQPGDGGKFVRTSGGAARVVGKIPAGIVVKLPSGKQKIFNKDCRASIGVVAGGGRQDKPFLKAGNKYYAMKMKNKFYPKVQGISMNAVAHPFGGKSSRIKGRPLQAGKHDPPGRKVGSISPRRTGYKR